MGTKRATVNVCPVFVGGYHIGWVIGHEWVDLVHRWYQSVVEFHARSFANAVSHFQVEVLMVPPCHEPECVVAFRYSRDVELHLGRVDIVVTTRHIVVYLGHGDSCVSRCVHVRKLIDRTVVGC